MTAAGRIPGPSILFCPADRPDRSAKAAAAADAVILDLEDAVAPADKAAARDHVASSTLDPESTIVRVNPVGGETAEAHRLDLAALDGCERVLTVDDGRVVFDGDPAGAVAAYVAAMR